ncbi:alpha/beta fold hydrolase [Telluribacter sp. SYSU D00476]|uniref:alpha/beta fold hydrolase n=1 Tax=Telluribacter sp. SYSU D00476 TaxID=2811430 RepID=UPI001FF25B5F|nr:alpha/beta hydrolase [Telluribacter sp. SYSU D00476]
MRLHRQNVVLLHGHGVDDAIWEDLDAQINDVCTVIRPNVSLLTSCHSMEDYADELNRFLTSSAVEKCILIGHSMGGYIALEFARKYPHMLEGFGLFHSTAFPDDEAKKEQRDKMAELLRNQGAANFLRHTGANMYGERYKELYPHKVQDHISRYGKLPAEALVAGINAMRNRLDGTDVLASMPFPVLFIIGMQDAIVPFERSMEMVRYPRQSYPIVLAEAGHMGMVERPDASARIIRWYADQL